MRRRLVIIGICVIVGGLLAVLGVKASVRKQPEAVQINIDDLLIKESMTSEDYAVLYEQTGLGRAAVDWLCNTGCREQIRELQEIYFDKVEWSCNSKIPLIKEEKITKLAETSRDAAWIPYVEEGDILVSFNCHIPVWRNGHAAIVVDAEKRLTLEATTLGCESQVLSVEHWEQYPSFIVLRLRDADAQDRKKVADYAMEQLYDVEYRLEAGVSERVRQMVRILPLSEEHTAASGAKEAVPDGTQCAHLVWYAYRQFGYDLDSDGGLIVTPGDLLESPLLEVVQIFGMER